MNLKTGIFGRTKRNVPIAAKSAIPNVYHIAILTSRSRALKDLRYAYNGYSVTQTESQESRTDIGKTTHQTPTGRQASIPHEFAAKQIRGESEPLAWGLNLFRIQTIIGERGSRIEGSARENKERARCMTKLEKLHKDLGIPVQSLRVRHS